jgi:hypothetical protein
MPKYALETMGSAKVQARTGVADARWRGINFEVRRWRAGHLSVLFGWRAVSSSGWGAIPAELVISLS